MTKYNLLLDIDETPYLAEDWFAYNPKHNLWSTPEMARIEAKRLKSLWGKKLGKRACILRGDNGYHLHFPDANLTKQEEEVAMIMSRGHRGHVYYSLLLHDTTLRVSKKPWGNSHPPTLVEVITFDE